MLNLLKHAFSKLQRLFDFCRHNLSMLQILRQNYLRMSIWFQNYSFLTRLLPSRLCLLLNLKFIHHGLILVSVWVIYLLYQFKLVWRNSFLLIIEILRWRFSRRLDYAIGNTAANFSLCFYLSIWFYVVAIFCHSSGRKLGRGLLCGGFGFSGFFLLGARYSL